MNLKVRGISPPYQLLLVLLLSCCWTQVVAQTLYSVILNSPDTDAGVVIDDQIYVLTPSKKSEIILQAKAPGGRRYYYVKLQKGTTDIIEREPFTRNQVHQRWTYNEFYGRNWNAKDVVNFDPIPDTPRNFFREDDYDLHPTGEIATIHVVAPPSSIRTMHEKFLDNFEVNVNITYISATSVKHFINCDFGVTGRTSRYFSKLPYKLKLPKDGYDLGGYRHFKLRATDNDPSYMREYLTTDIIHAMNQPGTKSSFVRLFFNDQAIGLFLLVEKYDATWLDKEFNPQKDQPYMNGVLYEGHGGLTNEDRADLSFKADNLEIYSTDSYEIGVEPKSGDVGFRDLIEFTEFVGSHQPIRRSRNLAVDDYYDMDYDSNYDMDYNTDWEKVLDVEGFLVNMAIEFFLGFSDGYTQNTNNFFLYYDPYFERFVYIPWDYDYTLGSGPFDMEALLVGDYKQFGRMADLPLTGAIFAIPKYRERFEKILDIMAAKIMDPSVSFPVIDSIADLIKDDVAWDYSLTRVKDGPSWITGAFQSFISGKVDKNTLFPYCTSIESAADFLIRVNSRLDLDMCVSGKPNRSSLLGVKEFFERKLQNYHRKSHYKPGLLEKTLH